MKKQITHITIIFFWCALVLGTAFWHCSFNEANLLDSQKELPYHIVRLQLEGQTKSTSFRKKQVRSLKGKDLKSR